MNNDLKRMAAMLSFLPAALVFFSFPPSSSAQADAQAPISAAISQGADRFGKTSEIIGFQVVDQQNQRVGTVKDVLYNQETGQAPLTVISFDSENKLVAVPTSLCTPRVGDKTVVLNTARSRLVAGPSFTETTWPDLSTPSWSEPVYTYYQEDNPRGSAVAVNSQTGTNLTYGILGTVSSREQDEYANALLHRYQAGKTQARLTDMEVWERGQPAAYPQYSKGSGSTLVTEASGTQSPSSVGKLTRASDLPTIKVQDASGRTVGQLVDSVVDWTQGRIAYNVVEPSDVNNPNYWAVPPTILHPSSTDSKTVVLDVDQSKLNAGPSFNPSSWPNLSDQLFLNETYQYYGQTPYRQSGRTQ